MPTNRLRFAEIVCIAAMALAAVATTAFHGTDRLAANHPAPCCLPVLA